MKNILNKLLICLRSMLSPIQAVNKSLTNMKSKILFLLVVLALLSGCQPNKSTDGTKIKKGMIKVAILYPNSEGKTFDMDYYSTKHMPMAATLFGDALKAMSIDKGLAGGAPDAPMPYLATGYFYFDDMESCKKAMGPNSEKLRADVPNYTNIVPVLQFSEVQTVE
jgi:uncharacterized protein (TIGR02118 family)